jgi:glycosyltransferase involved in cell wall biosynthesis
MGVMPEWFHFDWVARAARALPGVSFVLIGPDRLAQARLAGLANVHVLGLRDYATLPAYLQHAQVGLLPFDPTGNPSGVAALNPQKMYAYLATGLPVVATDWEELHHLDCPVKRGATPEAFIAAIRQALAETRCAAARRRFAAQHSWRCRMADLLDALAEPLRDAASALQTTS